MLNYVSSPRCSFEGKGHTRLWRCADKQRQNKTSLLQTLLLLGCWTSIYMQMCFIAYAKVTKKLSKQVKLSCWRWLYTMYSQSPGCFCRLLSLSLCLTVNLSSRKIPGLNVYAQMQNEKEQEMMSPANPTEAPSSSQRDLVHSLEILDTEFNSRPIGEYPLLLTLTFGLHFNLLFLHCLCHSIEHCFMRLILCSFFVSQRWNGPVEVGTRAKDMYDTKYSPAASQ